MKKIKIINIIKKFRNINNNIFNLYYLIKFDL